jgi:hypothetical protein
MTLFGALVVAVVIAYVCILVGGMIAVRVAKMCLHDDVYRWRKGRIVGRTCCQCGEEFISKERP